jgi:hypothetical protein
MTTLTAPKRLTGGQKYATVMFYLASLVLGWKAAQFATVAVLESVYTGYGIVWAVLSVQLFLAGFGASLYFMFTGRSTRRADLGAAGVALSAAIVAAACWVIMQVALR